MKKTPVHFPRLRRQKGNPSDYTPYGARKNCRKGTAQILNVVILLLILSCLAVGQRIWYNYHEIPRDIYPDSAQKITGLPGITASKLGAANAPVNLRDVEIPDWVTQDLLPTNAWSRPGDELKQVNGVVVHYVGNPGTTAQQNRSYFASLAETHETYASSHFVIGLDGEIIQCVPLTEISYCSSQRNSDTIAIECCHPGEDGQFNEATMQSLIRLLNWLIDTCNLEREDVIRHYDVTGKECPRYYVQNPEAWEDLLDQLTFPS